METDEQIFGVTGKHPKCKVCNNFDIEISSEISKDIIFRRKSYREILEYYNSLRHAGTTKLVMTNLNSHKKHCVPEGMAKKEWHRLSGSSTDPLVLAYNQRYHGSFDRLTALYATYQERVADFKIARTILNRKQTELRDFRLEAPSPSGSNAYLITQREQEVLALTERLSFLQSQLAKDLLLHLKVDKGSSPQTQITIIQTLIGNLETFFEEIASVVQRRLKDPDVCRELVADIARLMDDFFGHLTSKSSKFNTEDANVISEVTVTGRSVNDPSQPIN